MNEENENLENNIEIIENVEVREKTASSDNNKSKKSKNKSKKSGHGKTVIAGALVFGMAVGSAVTLTTMRDGMVAEITENISNSTVPASSNTDNSVNTVNVANNNTSNVVASVTPSVVSIGILGQYSADSLVGAGTGVVFDVDDENAYIVTNNHVIEGASGVKIWFDGIEDPVDAKLVGAEPSEDLAVISVSLEDLHNVGLDEVVPCTFGDSDDVRVGDSVIAIGNAMGEGISSTGGMISIKSKTIQESTGAEIEVIQTDASINPGNSGGALVNSDGEVIGINTAKMMSSFNSTVEGVGYAIPSNNVVEVIEQIRDNADSPYLGIRGFTIDSQTAELFSLPEMGVFVKDVIDGGSADLGGMQSNDIITSFNGKAVTDIETLQDLIRECEVGDKVEVIVLRNGEPVTLDIELMQQADANF